MFLSEAKMGIFGAVNRIPVTEKEAWFLENVRREDTVKRELMERIFIMERRINELIVDKLRVGKIPVDTHYMKYSSELKNLLLKQADLLEQAAEAAREEAKLERGEYHFLRRSY